jgi:hypothetical protein
MNNIRKIDGIKIVVQAAGDYDGIFGGHLGIFTDEGDLFFDIRFPENALQFGVFLDKPAPESTLSPEMARTLIKDRENEIYHFLHELCEGDNKKMKLTLKDAPNFGEHSNVNASVLQGSLF